MDKRIFLVALLFILVAGSIIGYNIISGSCEPFEIKLEPATPRTGDVVKFTSMADDPDEISWDFGDGQKATGAEVTHKYDSERKYTVTATITERCSSSKEIIILPKREMTVVKPEITIPSKINTGELITFYDRTSDASEWKWRIVETGGGGNTREFTTTFKVAGKYHLALAVKGTYINGSDTIELNVTKAPVVIRERIIVPDRPRPKPQPDPPPIKTPKLKPEPVVSGFNYQDNVTFATNFVRIATALSSQEESSSTEWKQTIVSQTGEKGSLKIILTDGQSEPKEMSLESFKTKQIILTDPYIIKQVKEIKRRPDNSISQITVVVAKN